MASPDKPRIPRSGPKETPSSGSSGNSGPVRGQVVDDQTRCLHWHGPTDVVAFRFACCDGWWPCQDCHAATAGHPAVPWPVARFAEPSVLCGVCRAELTVPRYVASGSRCPACGAGFNPRCRPHWPSYFEA